MANGNSGFGVFAPTGVGAPKHFTFGTRQGRPNQSAIGASQFENQIDNVFLPALQQQSDANRQALINANLQSFGSGSPTTPSGVPVAGQIPPTQAGPFTSIALTKDPELEAAVSNILSQSQETDLSSLVREPRSTNLAGEVGDAFKRFRGDVNDSRQSLEDFTKEFLSVRAEDRDVLDQENRVLGDFFGGAEDPNSLTARLERNATDRAGAVRDVVNQDVLANIIRQGKLGALSGGNSSFLQNSLGNAAAKVLRDEQVSQAELGRQNLLDVAGLQAGTSGRRGQLIDQFVRRALLPLQAQQQLSSNELANLGQLGNIDLANTVVEREGDQTLRDLGILGAVRGLRGDMRFEGLQKEFNDPGIGFTPTFDPSLGFNSNAAPFSIDQFNSNPIFDSSAFPTEPNLRSTSGNIFSQSNDFTGGIPFGAFSPASNAGIGGTTVVTPDGEFIRDAFTGQLLPVGDDRLTDLQRQFE